MTLRIPLFPLPLVLYPNAILPLHIFEPRYKRMVARCLEYDRRFGLVFHDPDRSGPFLMAPGTVGCVAEIERMQVLEDGRSLILAGGREKFCIDDGLESGLPYYEALVEPYEDSVTDAETLRVRRDASLTLFRSFLVTLPEPPDPLPDFDTGEELSYRLASTIETDPVWHQGMLELRDERDRLDSVDRVFNVALDQSGEDE